MLPLSDQQVVEVLLASLAIAVGLLCEVYDRLDEEPPEYDEVTRVNADVVVLEDPEAVTER